MTLVLAVSCLDIRTSDPYEGNLNVLTVAAQWPEGEFEMALILKILLIVVLVALALFVLTFAVDFFNLDMKLTAAIEPWLIKHYDKIKRDTHL